MRNPARVARHRRNQDRQARNGRGHGKAAWGQPATREEFGRAYLAASWAAEGRVTSDG
jgi:hypothetical protein